MGGFMDPFVQGPPGHNKEAIQLWYIKFNGSANFPTVFVKCIVRYCLFPVEDQRKVNWKPKGKGLVH